MAECLKPPFLGPTCPGLKPPDGIRPNFVDPPSQQNFNFLCQITCLVVCTISVAIRLYTRFYITRSQGREDYACIIAWCGLVVYCSLQLTPTFVAFAGVHQWDVMQKDLVSWVKLASIIEIVYNPIIFATKLSILLLYFRIFVPNGKSTTYYLIHFVIWFNLLFYIANIPIEIWPCVPRRKIWEPSTPGHCLNNEHVFVAGGTINVVSDFAILFLPIVSIARLQMPLKKKIGVSAIFATGLFACISSIMHLTTSITAARSSDKTYTLFPVALWTTAEIASGILCGSLLTMPHFFRHLTPKIVSKLYPSRSSRSSSRRRSSAHRIASFIPIVRRAKPAPQWHDRYDSTTDESYQELNGETWRSRRGGGGGGGGTMMQDEEQGDKGRTVKMVETARPSEERGNMSNSEILLRS